MRLFTLLLLITSTLSLFSCRTTENRPAVSSWLKSVEGKSQIKIDGIWFNQEWGHIYLIQKGNRLSGKFGDYQAEGRINGNKVYLALWYGEALYYTAQMDYLTSEPSFNTLNGYYYRTTDQISGWPIILRQGKK